MLKKIFKPMAMAQIISAMTVLICLLIDSIMIGHFLGVESIAAYGLSNPMLLAFAAIGSMISAGAQIICSKSIGRGDQEEINTCFSNTVALGVFVSIVGVALVIALRSPISTLLGAGTEGSLFNLTRDYLLGFILGAPAFLFSTILVPYLQLSGKQNYLVSAVGIMVVSDIILDLLNVFVFKGGMLGMGIASSVSYYLASAVGLIYFLKNDCIFHFSAETIGLQKIRSLLAAGIPNIINMLSTVLLTLTLNHILLVVSGSIGVAAYSIVSTISNIGYAFSSGIASTGLMIAGVLYCEEDRSSLGNLLKLTLKNGLITMLFVSVVLFALANGLVKMFVNPDTDPESARLAVTGVRLLVLSFLPSTINTVMKNLYQGAGKIYLTEFVSFLQNFACIGLFSYLLSYPLGINGVWLGYLCGELAVTIIICVLTVTRNHSLRLTSESLLMLPDTFGIPNEDCILYTVSSTDEAVEVSKKAMDYCLAHGNTNRLSLYTSLCIEEMCTYIVEYGFIDKKKHSADVRLFCKQDEIVIRIRDDGASFDASEFSALAKSSESAKHIGIRMIYSLAKDVNYTNSMSLNNLVLVLDGSGHK